jgi:uncharacterized protein with FMN-binding domain
MSNTNLLAKKSLLAAGVFITFVAYSFVLRNQGHGPIIAPASLKNSPSSGSSTSNTATTNGGTGTAGSSSSSGTTSTSKFKDGSYTGSVANAYYGNVQVQVSISGGKITNVQFLQYPNDNPNSQYINQQATPYLKQEAIQAQSAQVNGVTGATLTSQAFVQSLSSALNQAQA